MPTRLRPLFGTPLLAAVLALTALPLAAERAQAPPPVDPKYSAALQKGEAALKMRRWEDALDAFKDANNRQGKKSVPAMLGIGRAYHGLGAFKSEADIYAEALRYVGDDKRLAAEIHNQRGKALFDLHQQLNQEKAQEKALKDAEAEFRLAAALDEAPVTVWYNLGVALVRQSRDDEGRVMLQKFIETGTRGPELDMARKILENPRRGRETFAPEFSLTTMDGEFISLKDLAGKTVVLDFWGTWCGPCRAATPQLVRLQKKYAKEPNFVMIGISSDKPNAEQALREYITKNKMTWLQQWDYQPGNRHPVIPQFQVRAYPTYIVIDGEGIVRDRVQGTNIDRIEAAVEKSLKAGREKN